MKKILVDVRFSFAISASAGKFNGGNNYTIRAIALLARLSGTETVLLCRRSTADLLKERLGGGVKYCEIGSLRELEGEEGILFVPLVNDCPAYAEELAAFRRLNPRAKLFVTIHDRRYKELGLDRYHKYYYDGLKANRLLFCMGRAVMTGRRDRAVKKIARLADTVFTVSNYSMQSLNRIGKIKDIVWFYQSAGEVSEAENPAREHILFVSGGRCEKNFVRALLAYDRYWKGAKDAPPLVVTGVSEGRREKFRRIKGIDEETWAHVKMLGYVEDSELDRLYKTCRYLLYPSRNEGFGLPVLEAALRGRPSVASSASSVPEVISSAGVYVDPESVASIADGIARMERELPERESYLAEKREIVLRQIALDERIFLGYFNR